MLLPLHLNALLFRPNDAAGEAQTRQEELRRRANRQLEELVFSVDTTTLEPEPVIAPRKVLRKFKPFVTPKRTFDWEKARGRMANNQRLRADYDRIIKGLSKAIERQQNVIEQQRRDREIEIDDEEIVILLAHVSFNDY